VSGNGGFAALRLPEFSYLEPRSLQEACGLLVDSGSLPLSGGTDLLVNMKYKLLQPPRVVDIKGIADLALIQELPGGGIVLGALTTLKEIERSALVKERFPLLAAAARSVGIPQIRNKATLGGNICLDTRCWYYNVPTFSRKPREVCSKLGGPVCHVVPGEKQGRCYALFSADTVPVLMALEAKVTIASAEDSRVIPLRELYSGDGVNPLTLRRGELVTEVRVPPLPAGAGGAYLKLRERGTLDFPILGIAAVLTFAEDKRTCRQARIVLTGVSSSPFEATDAEAFLENTPLTAQAATEAARLVRKQLRVYPLNGISARYKRSMIAEYAARALLQAGPAASQEGNGRI